MPKVKKRSNVLVFVYEWMLVLVPWAVILGMLQVNFQRFLPYQRVFKGVYFFDYFTVTDIFVSLLLAVFVIGVASKRISILSRKLPREIVWVVILLMVSGVLQLLFQKSYEPVLSTPSEYFRGLFIYPILFFLLLFKTASDDVIYRTYLSYIWMVFVFSIAALVQFISGVFPGAQKDFTGRLTWPYIDFLTLKSSSANWAAFFVTPALILSFCQVTRNLFGRLHVAGSVAKLPRSHWLFLATFLFTGLVMFLTQSYGAFVAVFAALGFYLFRALPLKKFFVALLLIFLVGCGVYFAQTQTKKYQILTGQEKYRFDNSLVSRGDIYRMNLNIIVNHPLLGVGMNQYQSYFEQNHLKVLGHPYGESMFPPHAHNFFMGFWVSLGLPGFVAVFLLMVSVFWRTRFSTEYPASFVFLAIMIHGLVDSYYWKQEIAYTFWIVVALCFLLRQPSGLKQNLPAKTRQSVM